MHPLYSNSKPVPTAATLSEHPEHGSDHRSVETVEIFSAILVSHIIPYAKY